ncbi:hypothetical protein ARTHRO_60596 [Limnospira indica PCC 8005]|uniref:Uncharacterized protein n=3 Tax=Limnospira TaxID=2596745 RepID=A0A9P1P1I4_9CYAN|nr:hypothetical protein ARTHRO_20181 [Limnospira indica PCC 8005]CDM97995.1 hypothetical protein ARTHRO_60596 [Limnospira indica PCC 8005]
MTSGHIPTITVRHWLSVTSFPLMGLGVESEVTFTLSHSEPCLIVSHHTAPGVDTLFVKGAESRDLLSTSMFRAICTT